MLPASGTLAPTKTHARRSWVFIPSADPTAPHAGTVTVCRGKAPTTYLVGLVRDGWGAEVYFARQDDAADVYAVRLAGGVPAGCTCPGFRFAGHCLHRDAAAALIEDGLLG